MPTFYRIDFWHKSGNGSKTFFEKTEEAARAHVLNMEPIRSEQTEGIEHTSVHLFWSDTCDMQGWEMSDKDEYTPQNYATPDF